MYGILFAQMVLTVLVALVMMGNKSCQDFAKVYFQSGWMSFAFLVPTMAVLCCMTSMKNQVPMNYYLLFTFTFLMSLDVGLVCSLYAAVGLGMKVVQAFAVTGFIFGALTLYTFQSKRDFSFMEAYLFAGLLVMIAAGLLGCIFPSIVNNIVYPLLGALLFCGYIVYDTYKITTTFGYDDYIMAAIELYLDIINLFLYILQLLSRD